MTIIFFLSIFNITSNCFAPKNYTVESTIELTILKDLYSSWKMQKQTLNEDSNEYYKIHHELNEASENKAFFHRMFLEVCLQNEPLEIKTFYKTKVNNLERTIEELSKSESTIKTKIRNTKKTLLETFFNFQEIFFEILKPKDRSKEEYLELECLALLYSEMITEEYPNRAQASIRMLQKIEKGGQIEEVRINAKNAIFKIFINHL